MPSTQFVSPLEAHDKAPQSRQKIGSYMTSEIDPEEIKDKIEE